MLMHDDACDDSLSLQGVSNEQDYDAQHDVAEHPHTRMFCDAILRLEISQYFTVDQFCAHA